MKKTQSCGLSESFEEEREKKKKSLRSRREKEEMFFSHKNVPP